MPHAIIPDSVLPSRRSTARSFPTLRLTESHDYMTVVALVPGFSEDAIDITVSKDVLCIAGRCGNAVPGGFTPLHRGRRSTDFRREIKLLSDVAWTDTEAWLERGILTVRLRKDARDARSPIPIRIPDKDAP